MSGCMEAWSSRTVKDEEVEVESAACVRFEEVRKIVLR